MNERIRQLADKAIEIVANKKILADSQIERSWQPEYYDQVFAELIVLECADVVDNAVTHRESASTYVNKIKEHFGVE